MRVMSYKAKIKRLNRQKFIWANEGGLNQKRIFANKFSKIRYSNQNGKQRAFPEIFCEVALNRLREHP